MAINPSISLAARPVEMADPLAMYGKIAAIQQAQNQNALAQYQLGAAKRNEETQNALSAAYQKAYNPQTGEYDINQLRGAIISANAGAELPVIEKKMSELKAQQLTQRKAETELADAKLKQSRAFLDTIDPNDPNAPQQYIAWHEANHKDPVLGPMLAARGVTADQARSRIAQAIQQGPQAFAQLLAQSKLGTEKFMEQNAPKFFTQDVGGQTQLISVPGLGGTAGVVPGSAATKTLTPPAAIGEYQAYKAMSPAEQAAYVAHRQSLQPAPAQVNVKLPEQEKAEKGARGKLLVEEYKGISDAAKLAAKTLPAVETQERILDNGFKTGFGTDAQKAGASLLSALGVPEATKYATNAQTFLSATQQTVLQKQLEQKGPQTEADSQRVTQTGAQLGNTPEANKFIVSVAKAQLKRDIEQRNFYDKWWKTNNTYDGAEDAWFAGEGGKSLFERPELKQYAAPTKAAPAAPAATVTGTQPFSDAAKERRYQEWKRSQGKP